MSNLQQTKATAGNALPETPFPSLDTIYRAPIAKELRDTQKRSSGVHINGEKQRKNIHRQISSSTFQISQNTIFEAYARFIADFTGNSELAFYTEFMQENSAAVAKNLKRCMIRVESVEETASTAENPRRVAWSFVDEVAASDAKIDFAVEIRSQNEITDDNDTLEIPFKLTVETQKDSISNVGLSFEQYLLTDEDAHHLLNTLVAYLESAPAGLKYETSILNFPPLARPPVLAEDYTGELGIEDRPLLHSAFERRARDHPDRTALDFLQAAESPSQPAIRRVLTYGSLDRITSMLASHILEAVGPTENKKAVVVPILFSTSVELYISYLAVLKAGLAFAPLPLEAPPQRIQDIIEDLSPNAILGSEAGRQHFPTLGNLFKDSENFKWIDVETFCNAETDNPSDLTLHRSHLEEVSAHIQEDDVAYVMYTSGSTGKPKGVQITHISATCSISAHALTSPLPLAADGVPKWFQFAAPTFDPSLMEIFVTFSTGATLCSATRSLTLTNMESVVSELGATVMMSTPSMAALLRRQNLSSLRSLWTMGETLLRRNIEDFASADPSSKSQLVNAYGPTEASINCTLLPNFHPGDRGSIIGPALSTCSLFIIDPDSTTPVPVPRGFSGELAIGGPQVSIGYINRPEQNAKAFVDSKQFGRLYRTGDKARIVTDRAGKYVVEFLGRIDTTQVKLSGRRVDLGEIDAVVAASEGVKEVVTVSYKRSATQFGSEEAVTFLVRDLGFEESAVEDSCRDSAIRQLPSYMCPSKYFFVSEIPRSLAGKVDRKRLSALVEELWNSPVEDGDQSDDVLDDLTAISQSEIEIEAILRKILSDMIGCSLGDIKPTVNLFSLGIDSLRAIRLLQEARESGVIELGISDVLQTPTPRELARIVVERRGSTDGPAECGSLENVKKRAEFRRKYQDDCTELFGITVDEIEDIFPTTATQSGMLASFLRSSGAADKHYIHHSVHKINASIDTAKLQESWMAVLNRHQSYRIVFCPVDDPLSPFLQCVLAPSCPLAQKAWNLRKVHNDVQADIDNAIQESLKYAEDTIVVDKPSLSITLITSPKQSIVTFSVFHGIFDGASLQLMFDEVAATYFDDEIPRRTGISTAVDMHYNTNSEKTVDFWKRKLKDCEPESFPTLTGFRPETITAKPATTTVLSTVDIESLRESAKKSLSSPLAILQAAWSLLLVTYKDSLGSSTFGSVISGRLDPESEVCMGPTFTTVPVTLPSTQLSSDTVTTNSNILQYYTSENAKSLAHLQIPLNSVVAPNGGLYYDTLLAFQDFATGARHSELWSSVEYPAMGNDFAVMVEIWPESSGELKLRATYTDNHLNADSASLMLKQFNDIVSFIVRSPNGAYLDGRFASTPSESPLADSVPTDRAELLHRRFEDNVKLCPDDIALIFKGELESTDSELNIEWTYAQLNEKSNRLAQYLVRRFGPLNDKVVPFSLDKSPQLYLAILGILKAGGAWCPIDPAFPSQRRHDLIERTDASLLLVANETRTQEAGALPSGVVVVDINDVYNDLINPPISEDWVTRRMSPNAQNMAYLIWTSGTTGLPKGVQVPHKAAAEVMRSLQSWISKSDTGIVRCLQFSQPSFDVFVQDLFYTWGLRGTLISAPKRIMLGSFAELANQTNATHAHLTPAFATIIPRETCKTLQVVTMIGEALPQAIADDWSKDIHAAYNTYGPAEAAVVSTVRDFGARENKFKSTNIGFTLPSVGAFVINDGRAIMKNGVGELALTGPQLARGYWKDSEKTEERFFWNKNINDHMYMTGDIVRQLHDGSFEFVGRRDDLIKLAGQRVELSEISFAVDHSHPDIEQVVTMHIRRSDRPAKAVVVFVSVPKLKHEVEIETPIINNDAVTITNAVMAEARKTLPEHMIPSAVVVIGSIPVTTSAKIDRKSLQRSFETLDLEDWESKLSHSTALEWTEAEKDIVQHISDFSGTALKSIGRTSRLPALGVDSIGVIRLTARLKAAGYIIPIQNLLQSRTIADLCELLKKPSLLPDIGYETGLRKLQSFNELWAPSVATYLKTGKGVTFSVAPTLPLQENLLSESFRNHESYWSNHFFNLSSEVDLDRLQEAWKKVATENEALRVGFVPKAAIIEDAVLSNSTSVFIQVIYDTPVVDWSLEDVEASQFSETTKQRAQIITLQHQQNLFQKPCWAVTILDQGESRSMMFTVHHSIHDGPSLKYIINDLNTAYLNQGSPCAIRHQISDAVAFFTATKSEDADDMEFWEAALKNFASDEDVAGSQNTSTERTGHLEERMPLSIPYSELQAAMQRLQCSSVASILRVAWSCIVADLLEAEDKRIVMGEVLSERMMDESLDDVVGPLVTLVAVPFHAYGNTSELLARTVESAAATWKHRHVNPGTIRKLIKRPKNDPLYNAVFVFHPQSSTTEAGHHLWVEMEDHIGLNVEHDLVLNVEQKSDNSLDLIVAATSKVVSGDGLRLLVKQIDALVTAMVAHPEIPVAELTNFFPQDLISVTKPRNMVLDDVVRFENPLCWFEHWAKVAPHWPAVEVAQQITQGDTRTQNWSYSQLNEAAECVASFIRTHNVSGRMIGVCLGRTLTAFAVIVGIFKSGNTYLPIDEDLPIERKLFLLQDSNSAIYFSTGDAGFAPEGCIVVDAEHDQEFLNIEPDHKADSVVRTEDDVAYLLYTSGSTGNPKGVLISCGNLTSFSEAQSEFICSNVPETHKLGGTGKYLALASRAFDVHVAEMFLAWRWGLTCVTATRTLLLDDLALALKELEVTHASFVPSLLDQVGLIPEDVPLLKFMGVGGEKISKRTLEVWGDSKTVALINAYGPTEVTIGSASAHVSSKFNLRNIGKPLGDLVAHVLIPDTFTYAKRGMEGELCFTGSLVGIGYHNRDLPAFVNDFNGAKMYRTGDLVRLMIDDSIEIFGRADDQTKIRGQRLELGEVSACVGSLSSESAEVSSIITKHPELSRLQLVSFIAYSKKSSGQEELAMLENFEEANATIRSGCKERLPTYMVPDVVIPINFLPIAPTSGKADVKKLKSLFASIPLRNLLSGEKASSTIETEPSRDLNEDEEEVVTILQSVVAGDLLEVHPFVNIFELGVDSLVAISLSTKLRSAGYDCSVADILNISTIAELASLPRTEGSSNTVEKAAAVAAERLRDIETKFRDSSIGKRFGSLAVVARPSLPLQEAVVARSLNDDSRALYVNHVIMELAVNADIEKLHQSWESSARDNEILRTCFCQVENDILQVVLNEDGFIFPWNQSSVEGVDGLATFRTMQDDVAQDIMEKLQSFPAIRVNLIQSTAPNQSALLGISMHHALYDAHSLAILMNDVRSRYENTTLPERPPAGVLVEYLASLNDLDAKRFWTQALDGYQCPATTTGDLNRDIKSKTATRTLKKSLSALESYASQLHVTLPSLVQTVFGLAMAKFNSVDDFIFGLVLSGRTVPVPGVENLLAPSITTVPQRIDLRAVNSTILGILSLLQKSSGKILKFQHTSLRSIHRWVQADRPLFDCLFSYIKTCTETQSSSLWKEVESYMPPDYPFAAEFEARSSTDQLVITAGYSTSIWSESNVEHLLETMELLIETITIGNDLTIRSLGISSSGGSPVLEAQMVNDAQEWTIQETHIKDILLSLSELESSHVLRSSTFFRLGIDSVIAIRFAQKLRKAGYNISSSDVSRYPSIALLSAHISNQHTNEESTTTPTTKEFDFSRYRDLISPLNDDDQITEIFECTPLQAGLLTQTVASGGHLYIHHPTLQLSSDIDIGKLKSAWTSVIGAHDILRTTFHFTEEAEISWIAAVHSQPSIYWLEIETEEDMAKCVNDIVRTTKFPTPQAFAEPPIRVTVLKTSSASFMVVSLHHSLYDGWALPLIFDALSEAYTEGPQSSGVQFYEAARLITQKQDESVKFWLDRVNDYRSKEIPSSISHDKNATAFSRIEIGIPTPDIVEKCKAMNVTLQAAAMSAYSKVLCCLVKRRDVVFGHVVSGRSLPLQDVESIIGPLFNTIPFRVRYDNPLLNNEGLVKEIQQTIIDGQSYQHASLNTIQKNWRRNMDDGDSTLLDALFVFQKSAAARETSEPTLWQGTDLEDDRNATEYGLNAECEQGPQHVVLSLSSPSGRLNEQDLKMFCQSFDATLCDILDSPLRSATAYPEEIHDLPVSTPIYKKESQANFEDIKDSSLLAPVRLALSSVAQVPLENIIPSTSIYSIGIDSIAAIRVAAMVRRENIEISVADVLQGRSLGGIVRLLIAKSKPSSHSARKVSEDVDVQVRSDVLSRIRYPESSVEHIIPCLAGQTYHLASWLKTGRTTYEPTWTWISKTRLDPENLAKAWRTLQSRHAILRTIFGTLQNSVAYQVVLSNKVISDATFEVRQTADSLEDEVRKTIREFSFSPSDLFTPPIRFRLIQGLEQDAVLVKLHHSLYDAWTMTSLVTELSEIYLEKPLLPVCDFPAFIRYTASELDTPEETKYWKSAMKNAETTILQPRRAEIESAPQPSLKQTFVWVKEGVKGVAEMSQICRDCDVALSNVVILAFGHVLAKQTNTTNPTFGFFQVGRSSSFPDTASLSGPCVNLLPLVTPISSDISDLEAAISIQNDLGDRVPYEQSHLRKILSLAAHNSSAAEKPLFNASLNLLWHAQETSEQAALTDSLLRPLFVGVPTDFSSEEPIPGNTAVDNIARDYLAQWNLFCDVGPVPETDSLDFGVKCDYALRNEEGLREFVKEVCEEIVRIVATLPRKTV